jgi:Uma2 family endonuclease
VAALPWGRELTRADLATLPDDGHRYELLDGSLFVTPAPGPVHQVVAFELAKLLDAATEGTDLLVLLAPVEVVLSDLVVLQPDVVVAHRDDIDDRGVNGVPPLVAEVLSPSTRSFDLGSKRAAYEAAGVGRYWVLDPDARSLTAWKLEGESYALEARTSSDDAFHAVEPLSLEIRPAALLGRLEG